MDEEDLKILYLIEHCFQCNDTVLLESPQGGVLCSRCEGEWASVCRRSYGYWDSDWNTLKRGLEDAKQGRASKINLGDL